MNSCGVVLSAFLASSLSAYPTQLEPKARSSYASFGDGGFLTLSPDGRSLAYVVGNALWVTDLETDKHRQITFDNHRVSAPCWSPDSAHLAYYADREGRLELRALNIAKGQTRAFEGNTAFTINIAQPPQWSPDGKQLLFIAYEQDPRIAEPSKPSNNAPVKALEKGGDERKASTTPQVRVFSTAEAGGRSQSSLDQPKRSLEKIVDPDEQRFAGERNILVADVGTGQIAPLLRARGLISLSLSPDSKHLAAMGHWRRETDDQDLLDLYLLPVPDRSNLKASAKQRALKATENALDAMGRSLEPVHKDLRQTSGMNLSWSPDSSQLAYGTRGKLAAEDIYVIDVKTRARRTLTADLQVPPGPKTYRTRWFVYDGRPTPKFFSETCPPLWTRDGQALLCIGQGDVWLLPVQGAQAPRNLTRDFERTIDHLVHAHDGNALLYAADGESIFASTLDLKEHRYGFCRIDLKTGKTEQLWEETKRCGDSEGYLREDASSHTGRLVYLVESATQPPEVWLADRSLRSRRQVTKINPHWNAAEAGTFRLLRWKTTQGKDASGFLSLPPEARPGNKVPLIVAPAVGTTNSGSLAVRFLGARDMHGYASLVPDIPQGQGDQTDAILASVLPALDAAVATGLIDEQRIGVQGHSIGAFTVNVLITHTDRFRAAVSSAGISDWASFFLSKHRVLNRGAEDMAPPWRDPQGFIKNSPVYYLDKVTTPLLLLHGTLDTSVPVEQSEQGERTSRGKMGKI